MHECNYCDESFKSEDDYVSHLAGNHDGELSRVDKRRVEQLDTSVTPDSLDFRSVATAGVIIVAILITIGLVVFNPTQGPSQSGDTEVVPTSLGASHSHGGITVDILGEELDFSQPSYQLQDDFFHFEGGIGDEWHIHGNRVTLEYALQSLDIEVTSDSVVYDGTTYNNSSTEYDVNVTVNGEPVEPEQYLVKNGDFIRVSVQQSATAE